MSDTAAAAPAAPPPAPSPKQPVLLAVPALVVGVLSALVLYALDKLSELLQHGLWGGLPDVLGVPDGSRWWIFVVLTVVGMAVGLIIWKLPGHAGADSATTELVAAPPPVSVLPSLALAVVISLAGGVSLGPENPILAINAGLAVTLAARFSPKVPGQLVMALATAATIGALFGTPVAAALLFTGIMAASPGPGALWDKLFLPLVAAGAGAITMRLLGSSSMSFSMPAYGAPHAIDLVSGAVIASAAVLLALVGIVAFPYVHTFFHRLRNPFVYVTLGGIVLGVLGAVGGEITLFKGLSQTGELLSEVGELTVGGAAVIIVIKLAALVVSAAAGFRGGRIFPAVFIGAACGVFANALVPSVPVSLAVAAGVLGVVLAVARDGWVALFVAVMIPGDVSLLPVLCIIVLPAWLLVSRAPEMRIEHPVTEHWLDRPRGSARVGESR